MKLNDALPVCISLLISLLTVACQSPEEPPTPSPMPIVTDPITLDVTTTAIPEPTPSATPVLETATPLPLSATPTQSIVTLTPLPTFAAAELEMAVAELLANPMNCDVPCWWGAIPGITTYDEIMQAISPYNFDLYEYAEGEEVVHLRLGIGYIEGRGDFEVKIVYNFSHSLLTGVTAYALPISEILAKFGHPDEVWLTAMNDPREEHPKIWLNPVYLEKGIAVSYMVDRVLQDEIAIGCFADEATGELRLITPNNATNHNDFSPLFGEDRGYRPLEEATGLTIADFMQHFLDPTQPHCLETPAELWE